MNSDQLFKFKAIAEAKTMTDAARNLCISQPSLSYSLTSLENELGVKLFEREKNKLLLNENGKKLLDYTEKLSALFDEIVVSINSDEIIKIASMNTYAGFVLNNAPLQLVRKVHVFIADEDEMPELLFTSQAMIVITDRLSFTNYDFNKMDRFLIAKEQLGVYVKSDHKFFDKTQIKYKDLSNEKLIYRINNPSLNLWIARIIKSTGQWFHFTAQKDRYTDIDDVSLLDLSATNGLYRQPILESHLKKGERFIRIKDYNSTRLIYLWYLKENKEKVLPIINCLKSFYTKRHTEINL